MAPKKKLAVTQDVTPVTPVIQQIQPLQQTNVKSIEQKYQSMTQEEHILARPDTYVGDIQPTTEKMFVFDDAIGKITEKMITYVPGLYKIFDEVLVNSCDNTQTDKLCDTIKINVNKTTGEIVIWNNGKGIDIALHGEHNIYVPELIFGKLLTSTNYDDTEARTTGGRNGYGAKLANIFSKKFVVEVVDIERKLKFYQEFYNNMTKRSVPVIEQIASAKTGYVKISFIPDFSKFKITGLTDDFISLIKKRAYDIAGITNKCKVYYNDVKLECKDLKHILIHIILKECQRKKKMKKMIQLVLIIMMWNRHINCIMRR